MTTALSRRPPAARAHDDGRVTAGRGEPAAAGRATRRWFAQVGWRHLVGVLAVVFSLFPILFVISAAFNPLGTLSSTELVPTSGLSLENFTNLFDRTAFGPLVPQLAADRGRGRGRVGLPVGAGGVRLLPDALPRPAGRAARRCC